ncbi:MAG: hypothetical protein JST69_07695 [Bacteroidetes bacterium]|nr:hypothetical protein [Bacteroidota bacterium]
MKILNYSFVILAAISCAKPSPVPPSSVMILNTYIKSAQGEDLLDQQKQDCFKENDIDAISLIEVNGQVQEKKYNDIPGGFSIYSDAGYHYFQFVLPNSFAKKPIATYLRLSPTLVDTITYQFSSTPKFQYIPDKIFYNRKTVWDVSVAVFGQGWPPITIIK